MVYTGRVFLDIAINRPGQLSKQPIISRVFLYFWQLYQNIWIFNGCEVRTETSVTRVTVRYHEACRIIPNSFLEWQNLQFEPNNHYGFFSLHTLPSTIAFKLKYAISTFAVKKFGYYLRRQHRLLEENDVRIPSVRRHDTLDLPLLLFSELLSQIPS